MFWDLNKPWSCNNKIMTEKKKEKFNMHDFAVHDCTKEQNGSPYFSSIF